MQPVSHYPHGTFSWIDLSTPDPAAARQFYQALFGWDAVDLPAGESMVYTMLRQDGLDIAGLGGQRPEEVAAGVPAHWTSYVTVDDIEAIASRVSGLGGTLLMPPFAIEGAGQMAMVQDPTGAMFALWQPGAHIGARLVNTPNTFTWCELATRDTAAAAAFYTGLFGWEARQSQGGGMPYTVFYNGERMNAGMFNMPPEMEGVPPHWMNYIAVEDCDASVEKAVALGGKLVAGPMDIPGTGRFAALMDPQGAAISVIKAEQYDPPPGA